METVADDILIRLEGIWKCYGLLPVLKDRWRAFRDGNKLPNEIGHWALRDINLEVRRGETLGVIGRNGAGKSTLLKILAGVTQATRGKCEIRGQLFPMIELNAGLHPELTGRENVYLLGAIMGLTRAEITARLGEIEAFCELGEWFNRPVRQYSSGMLARLGFGVAVNVDADILLLDEVLGVGDLRFRNKCLEYLEDMRSRGRSFILVSHIMHLVRRLCDRVMVLEKGKMVFLGHPETAIERYEEIIGSFDVNGHGGYFTGSYNLVGAQLEQIQLLGKNGQSIKDFAPGSEVVLEFSLFIQQELKQVTINVAIESTEAIEVVWESLALPQLEPGRHRFCLHWHDLRLNAGLYQIRIAMAVGMFPRWIFRVTNALRVHIIGGDALKRGVYVPRSEFTYLGRVRTA